MRRNVFLSGSWDDTIKLWDMNSPASLATFKEHTYCVYAANWYAGKLTCFGLLLHVMKPMRMNRKADKFCENDTVILICGAGIRHMQTSSSVLPATAA